jgi:RNA polymerase sigma-70 factor (ECF subfamily)
VESRPLDDIELVERAKRGDVAAYEVLVCRYQEVAFRVACVMTRDPEAAKDAAQSGFINAYYALHRFRAGAPFRPWLLKIVANEARNQARSASRRTGYELRLAEGRPRDDAAPSPEEAALVAVNRDTLLAAVNALEEQARQVIACRYFLDLSEEETANALGCARGTVKSRLSRALDRLRQMLGDESFSVVDEGVHHE